MRSPLSLPVLRISQAWAGGVWVATGKVTIRQAPATPASGGDKSQEEKVARLVAEGGSWGLPASLETCLSAQTVSAALVFPIPQGTTGEGAPESLEGKQSGRWPGLLNSPGS